MTTLHTCATALAGLFIASGARAATETLTMDTLPSAQGWTFAATGVSRTEAATAAVAAGLMTFNTMGSGNQPSGSSILYGKTTSLDLLQSWYIEASVRLNAFESFSNFHGVYFGSVPLWVGIAPDRLVFPDLSTVSYAPGATFHTYRFEVQVSRAWTFYVDDVAMKTGTLGSLSGSLGLRIGDGTGGSNGSATYDYYTFNQPVPSPAGAAGLLAGALTVALRRRTRG